MAARIEEVREQDGNSMWSWSPPLEIAGLPDREPVEPGPLHIARMSIPHRADSRT